MNSIMKIYNKNKKKYIYGAGYIGKRVYNMMRNHIRIDGYLDNYSHETLNGVHCYDPKDILGKVANIFILVAVQHYQEIEEELIRYGYVEKKDYLILCKDVVFETLTDYLDECENSITSSDTPDSNAQLFLACHGNVTIGRNVHIGHSQLFCRVYSKIVIEDDVWIDDGCVFTCDSGSELLIGHSSKIRANCSIDVHEDSKVILNGRNYIGKMNSLVSSGNSSISLGYFTDTDSNLNMRVLNHSKCFIGEDCMFSYDVALRSEDGHPIYDINSGEIINKKKNVFIGDHCWIGMRSTIMPGCEMQSGCMVGACSLVNGTFEHNSLIVGSPARAVKKNIEWKREY